MLPNKNKNQHNIVIIKKTKIRKVVYLTIKKLNREKYITVGKSIFSHYNEFVEFLDIINLDNVAIDDDNINYLDDTIYEYRISTDS